MNKKFSLILIFVSISFGQKAFDHEKDPESDVKGACPLGPCIDPTSNEMVNNAEMATSAGKKIHDKIQKTQDSIGKVQEKALATTPAGQAIVSENKILKQISDWKESTVGFANNMQAHMENVQKALTYAQNKVDRWRTTLPTLENFADNAGEYIESSYDYISEFSWHDLIDLDQTFFRGLEGRAEMGYWMGLRFVNFLLSRIHYRDPAGDFVRGFLWDEKDDATYITKHIKEDPYHAKNVAEDKKLAVSAMIEALTGTFRLEKVYDAEYGCKDDGDFNVNCRQEMGEDGKPLKNENGDVIPPKPARFQLIDALDSALNNTGATSQDVDKTQEKIELALLDIERKRKIVSETVTKFMATYNDVLEYEYATKASDQKRNCISAKNLLFDRELDGDSSRTDREGWTRGTCDDVVEINKVTGAITLTEASRRHLEGLK